MSALLQYTKDDASPEIFRLWSAIQGIGSAGERRVWTEVGNNKIYPNLYVWLVSPPGIGKSMAIQPVAYFLRKAQCCVIAPNDLSKAGLLDSLATSVGYLKLEGRVPEDFFYMAILVSELANFMPKYDPYLTGVLTDLYDCPDINDESKRHGLGKSIPFPGLSMLVGTATGNLGATIPNEAWNSGFMARVIMIYANEEIVPHDMFAKREGVEELAQEINVRLRHIGKMNGRMLWTPDAQSVMQNFRENPHDTAPTHSRLINYCTRRWFHITKLCMVAALSEERMQVREADFRTAMSWLLQAEALMPQVFKGMLQHEDGALLEELRQQLKQSYIDGGKKPIEAQEVYRALSHMTAANRVPAMLEMALNADYLRRVAGTSGDTAQYIPNLRSPNA